jgi:hypothetical protein
MCVVGRGLLYQHQQTRAAAAREGCREMDATRKNRRPGGGARVGVLEAVAGPGGGSMALAVRWWFCDDMKLPVQARFEAQSSLLAVALAFRPLTLLC